MGDTDDTIAAKLVRTLHRDNIYAPRAITVDALANRAGVATSDVGRARELTHQLARGVSPIEYQTPTDTVALETDWSGDVREFIRSRDPSQLPWDMTE